MAEMFFLWFAYSFLGWCLEIMWATVVRAETRSRKCFILLPLCPVYGFAMLSVHLLYPFTGGNIIYLFFAGASACTAAEYVVHLFCDRALGVAFWDYSGLPLSVKGRVCLSFTLAWGVLSVMAETLITPAVLAFAAHSSPWLTITLMLLTAADSVFSLRLLYLRHDRSLLSLHALFSESLSGSS